MIRRHAGVLIHVEGGEAGPLDGLVAEGGEEGVLGDGGGEDDGGLAISRDGFGDDSGGELRAGGSGCDAIGIDAHFELFAGERHGWLKPEF